MGNFLDTMSTLLSLPGSPRVVPPMAFPGTNGTPLRAMTNDLDDVFVSDDEFNRAVGDSIEEAF